MRLIYAYLAILVQSLHFPGLISKDYPYNAELPIRSSYFYSAKNNRPSFYKKLKRFAKGKRSIFNFDKNHQKAPRYPVSETFDMCSTDHGRQDHIVADSPIAGYFGYSRRLTTSPFSVPLEHGIPLDFDKEKNRDGHDKCFTLC